MGSVMANGISSMLFGGRSNEAAPVEQQQGGSYQQQAAATSCEIQAKGTSRRFMLVGRRTDRIWGIDFTQCLQATSSDMSACAFYLDQLKACQQAASPY